MAPWLRILDWDGLDDLGLQGLLWQYDMIPEPFPRIVWFKRDNTWGELGAVSDPEGNVGRDNGRKKNPKLGEGIGGSPRRKWKNPKCKWSIFSFSWEETCVRAHMTLKNFGAQQQENRNILKQGFRLCDLGLGWWPDVPCGQIDPCWLSQRILWTAVWGKLWNLIVCTWLPECVIIYWSLLRMSVNIWIQQRIQSNIWRHFFQSHCSSICYST